ncbi:MAG: ABC transporter substrate-binding protein [Chloroflexota bacterium]
MTFPRFGLLTLAGAVLLAACGGTGAPAASPSAPAASSAAASPAASSPAAASPAAASSAAASPAAASPAAASPAAGAKTPLTVGYFTGPNPETLGQKYHLFGSNVKFSNVQSGITAFQEMTGGSLQLSGGIGSPPLAIALLQGLPIEAVYVEYNFQQSLVVSPKIGQPAALKGATIAITSGTTSDKSFADYLRAHSIDPQSVHTLNMNGTDMVAAFKRGSIQGAYIWDPIRSQLTAAGGRTLDTSEPIAVVVASQAVIKAHPRAVQRYVCDISKSNDYIGAHHNRALTVFTALFGGDKATAETVISTRHFFSPQDNATWMANNGQKLAGDIASAEKWANGKSQTPAKVLPDAHKMVDVTFADGVAGNKCG